MRSSTQMENRSDNLWVWLLPLVKISAKNIFIVDKSQCAQNNGSSVISALFFIFLYLHFATPFSTIMTVSISWCRRLCVSFNPSVIKDQSSFDSTFTWSHSLYFMGGDELQPQSATMERDTTYDEVRYWQRKTLGFRLQRKATQSRSFVLCVVGCMNM